jgi:predicted SnoaL-like aldol condensation-catalyzing enzyme
VEGTSHTLSDPRLQATHELWATFREHGAEAAIPLLHPDVEFVDHEGRVFTGHDGVRAFFAEFAKRGEEFQASPYTFELHEPDLLVVGHRRIVRAEGTQGDYLYFVHSVRDGRVSRIAACNSREEALADIATRHHQ